MQVVFRVDGSHAIGTGHVMRCLTLADYLSSERVVVSFVCRELTGHMCDQIEARGYVVHRLPIGKEADLLPAGNDDYAAWLGVSVDLDARETGERIKSEGGVVDWLIVDHYALGNEWHQRLLPSVGNIMVIDDLANRRHDCSLLLDQNFATDAAARYRSLISESCRLLPGPEYALLRPEFSEARDRKRVSSRTRQLFVFLGGVDRPNVTARVIEALAGMADQNFETQVIVGQSNIHRRELAKTCSGLSRVTFCEQVDDMAARMAGSDLAIGAAGTTTWERCAVGLPSLLISVAENQVPIAREAEQLGIGKYLGSAEEVTVAQIKDEVELLLDKPDLLAGMRQRALDLVDGKGVERVGRVLLDWPGRGD